MTGQSERTPGIQLALDAIQKQGGGLFTIDLFHLGMIEELSAEADAGDEGALRKLMAAEDFVEHLDDLPPGSRPPRCILCNAHLGSQRVPMIFAIVHAHTDDGHYGLVSAVCEHCANELSHDYHLVRNAVTLNLRDSIGDFHPARGWHHDG